MEKMLETGRTTRGIKKNIANAAKEASLKYHLQVLAVSSLISRY
jgi:hypothetical protein